MSHIFISYSHKDKEYVHKLQVALIERGINAWIDDRIDYGSEWPDAIGKRLQECSAFVLVMTPNAQKSHWVKNEFHNAIELEKPIFSLLLEGEIWWSVKSIQAMNVRDGALPPERFFNNLRQAQAAAERNAALVDSPKNEINITGNVSGSTIIIGDSNKVSNRGGLLSAGLLTRAQQNEPTVEEIKPTVEESKRIIKESKPAVVNSSTTVPHTRNLTGIAAILGISMLLGLISIAGMLTMNGYIKNALTATAKPTIQATTTRTPQPQNSSAPTPYPAEINQKGAVMLLIPAGSFMMGSDNGEADEKPPHTVTLPSFYMDKYETSNVLYKACVDAKGCIAPAKNESATRANYYGNAEFDNYPVIYVSWGQAKAYCEWRGARLPTEAEWEYAARAPLTSTDTGPTYPWGEGIDSSRANYYPEGKDTSAVDSYEKGKNLFYLYNMAGNVLEWVNDWYSSYESSSLTNPSGPTMPIFGDEYRVIRGGAWDSNAHDLRASNRVGATIDYVNRGTGFRCASSP